MNLAQMQMEYGQQPNGKVALVPARPPIKFVNFNSPRSQQAANRARKSDYRPQRSRPQHDNEWKVGR
jgi:hypothetical protein